MSCCPSQDWDRYVRDEEATQVGQWLVSVSQKIAEVDLYWNAEEESLTAVGDDAEIRWGNGIEVVVPYDRDLTNDDSALVIRTLHKKGRKFKIFPTSVYSSRYIICVLIPSCSPECRRIYCYDFTTREDAEAYLAFCCSDEESPKE